LVYKLTSTHENPQFSPKMVLRILYLMFWIFLGVYHFANYIQNFIHYPAVKVNSIFRGTYLGSSIWI